MAVTIHTSPKSYALSGNPVEWTFSSNQTAQANFSYIVEVYVNAVLHSTHQTFPQSGINGKFNASSIAELVTQPPLLVTGNATNNATMYIIVRENYGTPPVNQANATSSTITVFKAKLALNECIGFDIDDYRFTNNNNDWLTQMPKHNLRLDSHIYLNHLIDAATLLNITYRFYDASGSLLQTVNVAIAPPYKIYIFKIETTYLESIYTASSFDNVSYVTVQLYDNTNTSELLRIDIDRSCENELTTVDFISRIGALETFNFNRRSIETPNIESKSYSTTQGSWSGTSYIYTIGTGQSSFQLSIDKTLKLTSDWISDSMYNYLVDNLCTSPYIIVGGVRMAIESFTSPKKKKPYDTLLSLEVSFKLLTESSMIV
jgi:hypothetical protein